MVSDKTPSVREPKGYSEEPREANRHVVRMSKWVILCASNKESYKPTAEGQQAPKESVPPISLGVCV